MRLVCACDASRCRGGICRSYPDAHTHTHADERNNERTTGDARKVAGPKSCLEPTRKTATSWERCTHEMPLQLLGRAPRGRDSSSRASRPLEKSPDCRADVRRGEAARLASQVGRAARCGKALDLHLHRMARAKRCCRKLRVQGLCLCLISGWGGACVVAVRRSVTIIGKRSSREPPLSTQRLTRAPQHSQANGRAHSFAAHSKRSSAAGRCQDRLRDEIQLLRRPAYGACEALVPVSATSGRADCMIFRRPKTRNDSQRPI